MGRDWLPPSVKRSPLRRSPFRRKPRKASPADFSPEVRALVYVRSKGLCEIHGSHPATDLHHRDARGMGGSSDPSLDCASNALHVCREGHRYAEEHPEESFEKGWRVRTGFSPRAQKVLYMGLWATLSDEGLVEYLSQ